MAKLKGNTRSNTRPTLLGRIRKRFKKKTSAELTKERGLRLQREAMALEEERKTARQLRLEAQVEAEREKVREETAKSRARLAKIDVERAGRTRRGRAIKFIREKGAEAIKQARKPPRRRRKAKRQEREIGAFGIEL